ncbi:MAG TPA: hypothetical protein PKH24_08765 [Sedimentisphaerales bacterium]|jgi:hypothetical protein|nr:hypothetical protein [Sedimentisphaerales bacterium]HNU28857.1 hypothetical protein [Sedimentisphaerales bacterium]
MAFEPGGYAEKLGNRHEGRWVVKQLLRGLNEQVRSVMVEAIGDDQQGVDLVVETMSGTLQFHQCKARNGSKECWTLSDLDSRGILRNMTFQLDRSAQHEFWLVTGVPASVFGDICESARNSSEDTETYYKHQIDGVGEDRRKTFRQFCEHLGLDECTADGRARAYSYLRRIRVELWTDTQSSYDELLHSAKLLVNGQPQSVVASLAGFAQDNLRRRIVAADIWTHLQESGFEPRRLAHDDRVAPAIEKLKQQFRDSMVHGLVDDQLIPRSETQELKRALDQNALVILHGTAGYGKSGILYELSSSLDAEGAVYLPVRLDRQQPHNTPREFGLSLGLPESPALCLDSQSGGGGAVLVLDQLDAMRWTSSHSANSLEVCKALVDEVRSLRDNGRPMSVVLSCRTFDLEHDPQIKNWLEDQGRKFMGSKKIEEKGLPDTVVDQFVSQSGRNPKDLTQRQKEVLASPQNLAMWVTITREGQVPDFQSGTQLMREFWRSRYKELARANVNPDEADTAIDEIVDYMERTGRLSAPASLIDNRQKVAHELHTLDVLRTHGNQVMFSHQSYLDFRIADRLLRAIHKGTGRVKDWLGPKEKQSLFRREQLRQVLFMLSDESPHDFLENVKELIESRDIRFHLKHLVLEVVAQIQEPKRSLCEYLLRLWNEPFWQPHIRSTVIHGQPQYVQFLIAKGLMSRLFDSKEGGDRNTARWLVYSVAEKIPDVVTDLLSPCVGKGGEWLQLVLASLCWDCEKDSDAMFELRLDLARAGIVKAFVNWKALTQTHPLRAIRLIEAVISTWDTAPKSSPSPQRNTRVRFEQWTADDVQGLKAAATKHAAETWTLLMPHVERLTSIEADQYDPRLADWPDSNRYRHDDMSEPIHRGVVELLCESGRKMATDDPSRFAQDTEALRNSISHVTQEILITSYAALSPQFADVAVGWLLADTSRFRLGTGYVEPEWMPAVRLIEAQSPHCSKTLFRQLEYAIVHYHCPDEKRVAEYHLARQREGYFGHYWGQTQHFLLPALCRIRRSAQAEGLIGVLGRRFHGYPQKWFLRGSHMSGGWVGSPIRPERLHRVSDEAWLGIVTNKQIPEDRTHRWKQIDSRHVVESSITQFACDLRTIAKRFPSRFARLALRFPPDAHPSYIAAILDGVKSTKRDDIPQTERASWQPADVAAIEAIFDRHTLGDNRSVAHDFCWLIKARADEKWSDKTIDRLLDYAMYHPDPREAELNIRRANQKEEECTVDDLNTNAINCIRGVAGVAIGALLWEHPELLDKLKPAIVYMANDPHPAVRVAALEAGLPLLNLQRDLAVDLFIRAGEDDLRVAASRHGVHYFNACMESHADSLSPVVIRMFNSEIPEVAQEGAKEVCARWIFHGLFDRELRQGIAGSTPQRKGIAEVTAHLIGQDDYREKCVNLLLQLFNDPDKEVRQKAAHAVYNKPELLRWSQSKSFVGEFIRSQAFTDDPTGILFTFEECPGSLVPFAELVFAICQCFVGPLGELSRDISTGLYYDASKIPSLLLRLYEQCESDCPVIAVQCLDAWDILFENRIGSSRDTAKAIDR